MHQSKFNTTDTKLLTVFEAGVQYGLDAIVAILRSLWWFTRIVWRLDSRKTLKAEVARGRILGPLSILFLSALLVGFLEDPAFVLSHLASFVPDWVVGVEDKGNFIEKGYWYFPVASTILACIVGACCYKLAQVVESKYKAAKDLAIWTAYFFSGAWLWASIVLRIGIRISGQLPWFKSVTINASTIIFWGGAAYVLLATVRLGYSMIEGHVRFGRSASKPGNKAARVAIVLGGAVACVVTFEILIFFNEWMAYRGLSVYRQVINDNVTSEFELTGSGLACDENKAAQGDTVTCRTMIQNGSRRDLVLIRVGKLSEVRTPLTGVPGQTVPLAKAIADTKLPVVLKPGTGIDVEFVFPLKTEFCTMFLTALQEKTIDSSWKYDIVAKNLNMTRADGEFVFGNWKKYPVGGEVGPNTNIDSSVDCSK